MNTSPDRILTTHVGSLPRPDDLVALMFAKAEGEAVDAALLEQKTQDAVIEVVARQREAGIDIVSDGEMSKPSYATYVTERLTGFGTFVGLDLVDPAVAWRKLAALSEGARLASGELW